jgi:hypothetical protein
MPLLTKEITISSRGSVIHKAYLSEIKQEISHSPVNVLFFLLSIIFAMLPSAASGRYNVSLTVFENENKFILYHQSVNIIHKDKVKDTAKSSGIFKHLIPVV